MLKVSELLSKPVLSLYEAKKQGIIKNIIFDSKLKYAKAVQIFCEEDSEPDEKFINLKDIYKIGKDVAVIKNCLPVYYSWQNQNQILSPVNADIFTPGGEKVGKVTDVAIDETSFAVLEIFMDKKGSIKAQDIAAVSNDIIILQSAEEPVKLTKAVKRIPKSDNRIVKTSERQKTAVVTHSPDAVYRIRPEMSGQDATSNVVKPEEPLLPVEQENYTYYKAVIENNRQKSITLPERIPKSNVEVSRSPQAVQNSGYGFLIGRKTSAPVTDSQDKVIVKKGVTVDEKVIDTAKASGRIVQLALSTD